MTTIINRNEVLYENTTVVLPSDIKKRARDQGISFSKLLVETLEDLFQKQEGVNATNTGSPADSSTKHKEVLE